MWKTPEFPASFLDFSTTFHPEEIHAVSSTSCRNERSYKRQRISYERYQKHGRSSNNTCTPLDKTHFTEVNQELCSPFSSSAPITATSSNACTESVEPISNEVEASVLSQSSEQNVCTLDFLRNETIGRLSIAQDLVCYGQLNDFCQVKWLQTDETPTIVSWHGDCSLLLGHQKIRTNLSQRAFEILTALRGTASAFFDFGIGRLVRLDNDSAQEDRKSSRDVYEDVRVHVVIYGPMQNVEDVGAWLDDLGLFLQLPTLSSYDILYYNPHAMSVSSLIAVTTGQLKQAESHLFQNTLSGTMFGYEDTVAHNRYKEAQQPTSIRSILKPHQLQALTFMQGRELGWDLQNERNTNDLWRYQVDRRGRARYQLTLTSESRHNPPLDFKGGILADDMGLGKTCTMLSLIASSLRDSRGNQDPTLIIVTLPILHVWEEQIDRHFKPRSIVSTTYYKVGKPARGFEITFDGCHIVLTTYNTVSKEWKAHKRPSGASASPLFRTFWHRLVLDEAHMIKNKDADVSKAVSALNAECRWCITGTPIQNRSSDIYSLLKFLRVYPFDDYRTFEATFVEPWTQRNDETALHRFRAIMGTISNRRSRTTIDLPKRIETICNVTFGASEMRMYEQARMCASDSIDDAVDQTQNRASGAAYLNTLQKINDLRYICNHGTQPRVRKQKGKIPEDHDVLIEKELQAWAGETAASSMMCDDCGYHLMEAQEVDGLMTHRKRLTFCPNCEVHLGTASTFSSPTRAYALDSSAAAHTQSSKIRKLVEEVLRVDRRDKCVVFSYWTSTLKAIAQALTNAEMSFLTYDGSMTANQRDSILSKFKRCNTVRAILISISCGGQGLDLTAANHAFMVEPQWNPMLEEQAMARVHRLGQKKDVYMVRMIVGGTFEESIVKLQDRKRLLADIIVDNKRIDKSGEAYRHLIQLRDLVS